MYPMSEPDTPEAQFGANMSRGQQRRFNRRLNRFIGDIPIPMNGLMPAGIVTYPMLNSMQGYMPATGSYQGGPRLANIDVRRTGLFGRPKEYTITFANEVMYNPTLRKQVVKQEARNRKVLTEDEVDELLKKEEEITGESTETKKAEEEKETSGKKDISSNSATSRSNTSSTRAASSGVAPVVEEEEEVVEQQAVAKSPAPWESALSASKPEWANVTFPESKTVTPKSIYSGKATPADLVYYNPDKPGYLYTYSNGNLYYKDVNNASDNFHQIKDAERIGQLNQKLRGADLFTLPSKPGYYYRQRADGSFAKFQGDPTKIGTNPKGELQISVIKPGDKNYDYLNKNKQYSFTYSGKKQFGGFTDVDSGLNKFVYGGDEGMFTLPETGGKLTNSPYFEDGGELEEMAFGGRRFMNRLYDQAFQYNQDGQGPQITGIKANRRGLFRKNYDIQFAPQQQQQGQLFIDGVPAYNYTGTGTTSTQVPDAAKPASRPSFTGSSMMAPGSKQVGGEKDNLFDGKIVKAYKNGKFIGYMEQSVAEKNNLDWNSVADEERETTEDYNTNPQTVFPGGTTFKQKGLPYFTSTGDPYTGYITPWTDLKNIEVKRRFFGPDKMTYNFGNYDPTRPLIGPGPTSTPVIPQEEWTRRQDRQAVRDELGRGYKLRQMFQDTMSSKENDRSPRLRNFIDQRRSEKLGVPFTEPMAYGGDIDYAQTGLNYPYARDPRFAPVYTDNPDFVGMSDVDLVSPDVTGMVAAPAGIIDQSVFADYNPSVGAPDITQTTAYKEAQKDPAMNVKIDPNQPNRQTQKKNLEGDFSVKGNVRKPKTNADYIRGLMMANTFGNTVLDALGERGRKAQQMQMRNRYLADNLYGSTSGYDRGTYEANSGLFRPDQMGFTGVIKYGGEANYQVGGETYMSEDQVRKFLEEGGELEFV